MSQLKVKIEYGYGQVLCESENQLMVSRIMLMIHEDLSDRPPEIVALEKLGSELSDIKNQLESERWRRERVEKELQLWKEKSVDKPVQAPEVNVAL